MLRQCSAHGYFIGLNCPVCNEEGKFIMSDREMSGIGRLMAGVLRHFPEKFNLEMDINGWINIGSMTDSFKEQRHYYHWLRPWHFKAICECDDKGRFQIEGDMIRATYAHSVEIELDHPTDDIPEALYWPCNPEEIETYLELGLKPSEKQNYVHLSKTIRNAMEAGHVHIHRPSIIEIDTTRSIADGHVIYRAGTTVFLTEAVLPSYIDVMPVDDPVIQEIVSEWEEEEAAKEEE